MPRRVDAPRRTRSYTRPAMAVATSRACPPERHRHAPLRRRRGVDPAPARARRAVRAGARADARDRPRRRVRRAAGTRSTGPATASSSRSRARARRSSRRPRSSGRSRDEPWPPDEALRLRIGIHTGEPELGDEGYVGMDVVVAARICAAAHGEQIVVSRATRDLAGDEPARRRLVPPARDGTGSRTCPSAEQLFQLVAPGCARSSRRSGRSAATSLPALHHRLVGRADALARIESLLDDA